MATPSEWRRGMPSFATGTSAALPGLPGLDAVRRWTSREVTSAAEVPGRLAVVGGGAVAVEMATAWQALGAEVTMLVRGDAGLLLRMEPFAGEMVADGLREAGVDPASRHPWPPWHA